MNAHFKPLRIEVTLTNLSIPSMPIHLDDIIAAAAVIKAKSIFGSDGNDELDYSQIIDNLPIDKHSVNKDWVYKASIFNFKQMNGKFMRSTSRRFDQREFANARESGVLPFRGKQLNSASGPYKSSIALSPTASFVVAESYCIGDKNKIDKLISCLDHIGKKHNRGQGKIIDVSITECDEENAWQNRFLALSMEDLKGPNHALVSDIGLRPPYWKNEHNMAWGIGNF